MLPTPQLLNKITNFIQEKGKFSYFCLFLLGEKAGLRVSEAVNFNLNLKKKPNLYLIQGKRHKKRVVFVDPIVISELQKINWKPQQTNRFSYAHFLQRVKKELEIPANIELTPHTLRRCFATYQAINGMPLPVLQQVLGHSSIRTTALYWKTSQEPKEKFFIDKWLTGKLPEESPKSPENNTEKVISENNWEIFINIHQELNIFVENKPKNSEQELLAAEKELVKVAFSEQREQNKLLQAKIKQLEYEKKRQEQIINNLQINLEKALNDKQKLEKVLIQTQNEKENLLKMLSVDLQNQYNNLLNKNFEKQAINQQLHQQLNAQIEISLK